MKNKKLLEEYEKYLKVNGRAERTIKNHLCRVKSFLEEINVDNITPQAIQDYFLKLQTELQPSSINQHRNTLTVFLRFLQKNIKLPDKLKTTNKLIDYIDPDYFKNEIITMSECIFDNPTKPIAILYLLFYTGIRVGEIDYIKRDDINLEARKIKIYGEKTKEERIVKFNETTKEVFKAYFMIEEETNAFNIKSAGVRKICEKLNKNLDKHIYPHLFRHSFAIMLAKKGVGLETLRKLMGHSDLKTTAIYLRYKDDDISEMYDKYID